MTDTRKPKQPPEKLYLQWFGDSEPDEVADVDPVDVTWASEAIFDADVEYVRVHKKARKTAG